MDPPSSLQLSVSARRLRTPTEDPSAGPAAGPGRRFKDPTNDIVGLSRYLTALTLLFDPASSSVQLRRIAVVAPREIEAVFVLGGYLKLPWKPYVKPFEGTVRYSLNESGLVQTQSQTWAVSAAEALLETFTPTRGPPVNMS